MSTIEKVVSETHKLQLSDENSCSNNVEYHVFAEHAVSLDNAYITGMHVKKSHNNVKAVLAVSQNTCVIVSLNGERKDLNGHTNKVTGVKFSHDHDNIIYTSCLDGRLRIFDLRASECVRELKDPRLKPLTCLDTSSNERILCAGTELVEDDAYLLFWDIRSRKLLGGYWESQTDDITSVAFHPHKQDTVCTSSVDGLVNIFDLKETNEDDALLQSLNIETSVSHVQWLNEDHLAVLTHTEIMQFWENDAAEPFSTFSREKLAPVLSSNVDDIYITNAHTRLDNRTFLLAGSSAGKGECLKIVDVENYCFSPLIGNRQIVRTSFYLAEDDLLLTAGESGCLTVWKSEKTVHGNKKSSTIKAASRNKLKHKPYQRTLS